MSAAPFLELLNGGAITPEIICLVLLGRYLVNESKRRGLRAFDWLKLPPSMNLILAVFISDLGVFLRSATVWHWRHFTRAPDFTGPETFIMMIGAVLVVLGPLCKVRALTEPDFGRRPWVTSALLSFLFFLALIVLP